MQNLNVIRMAEVHRWKSMGVIRGIRLAVG